MQVKTVYHCIPCSEPGFSGRDRKIGEMSKAAAAVGHCCRSLYPPGHPGQQVELGAFLSLG